MATAEICPYHCWTVSPGEYIYRSCKQQWSQGALRDVGGGEAPQLAASHHVQVQCLGLGRGGRARCFVLCLLGSQAGQVDREAVQ